MGLFDVFKDKDEDSDNGGITEEYRSEDTSSSFESEPEPVEETMGGNDTPAEETMGGNDTPAEETTSYAQPETAVQSQLGIEGLMDKRFKLGEAIDYVGLMIKNLKEKRTNLVKVLKMNLLILRI